MEVQKPNWLIYAVDIAQILSAIATAAAVIVAIWLARRGESQRLRFFISEQTVLNFGTDGACDSSRWLMLTVVNSGVLPAVIQSVTFSLNLIDGSGWACGLSRYDPSLASPSFPVKLEHGQEITGEVAIKASAYPWSRLRSGRIKKKDIKFVIVSSLGKTYIQRPSKRVIRHIEKILNESQDI